MTALLDKPTRAAKAKARASKVVTVLVTIVEVSKAGAWVGDIFLSDDERVLKRGPEVPRDVVLKVLVAMTRRDETAGAVRGRDGQTCTWQVVGEGD
jgi:hypothetical protein